VATPTNQLIQAKRQTKDRQPTPRGFFWRATHAIITDGIYVGKSVGTYRWNCRRIYSIGNVPVRNFFLAHAYPSVRPSVFHRWVFFLFATDLATEIEVIDDWYTDRRVLSVRSSVIISPTDFILVTDGINPSVKLVNSVVNSAVTPPLLLYSTLHIYIYRKDCLQIILNWTTTDFEHGLYFLLDCPTLFQAIYIDKEWDLVDGKEKAEFCWLLITYTHKIIFLIK